MSGPKFLKIENATYFITCSIVNKIDIFVYKDFFQIIINSLKFCREKKGLKIFGYVIMPNHLHLIVNAFKNIEGIIRDFKHFTANQIIQKLKEYKRQYILNLLHLAGKQKYNQNYQVWEHKNYPEIIETEKFFIEKLRYIHDNPVKRGFVIRPEYWLYSSARNYILNDDSIIKIDKIKISGYY